MWHCTSIALQFYRLNENSLACYGDGVREYAFTFRLYWSEKACHAGADGGAVHGKKMQPVACLTWMVKEQREIQLVVWYAARRGDHFTLALMILVGISRRK